MNNQIFDWTRFTAALRKEVVENRRLLVLGAVGIYVMLAVIMIFGNLFEHVYEEQVPHIVVFTIFSIGIIISASLTFRQLKTKVGRIEYFTSPSSTLEKFIVNILIYVIGFIVAFFACAQLADLTRWGVASAFSAHIAAIEVPGPINFLAMFRKFATLVAATGIEGQQWIEAAMWIGVLGNAALFALGSALWPKLSFLKTIGAVYAIETVLGVVFLFVMKCSFIDGFVNWVESSIENGTFFAWAAAFAMLQVIIYGALCWYLFKHKDAVSLKWWK